MVYEIVISALLKIRYSKRKREDTSGAGKEGILIWYRDLKKSGEPCRKLCGEKEASKAEGRVGTRALRCRCIWNLWGRVRRPVWLEE